MNLHYEDATVKLWHGDCIEVLRTLPDSSVDSVVCDPPYGLSNTDPGSVADTITKWATGDREHVPTGRGFMGKAWDAFVPPPAVWDECLRVLKPGGHMVVFAGSRTQDLMGLSIRLAGFEIRDSVAWLYGSGFPKSLDVSKAVDKGQGKNRERQLEFTAWMRATGITATQINAATDSNMGGHYLTDASQPAIATADMLDKLRPLLPEVPERIERLVAERTGVEWTDYVKRPAVGKYSSGITRGVSGAGGGGEGGTVTASHSDEAKRWEGWGTALKPAHEPVIVARKPLSGTVAANVQEHGTGALNIDACRVGNGASSQGNRAESEPSHAARYSERGSTNIAATPGPRGGSPLGRWPANVVLDESQAAELDAQAPDTGGSGKASGPTLRGKTNAGAAFGARNGLTGDPEFYGDKGGASRFFYTAKAPKSERPVSYQKPCNCETMKPCEDTSLPRDTAGSRSTVDRSWNTSTSGNSSTALSQPGTTSTTGTGTSSTTHPGTSSSSPSSNTSESTPGANSEKGSGGSPAGSAENSSRSTPGTGTSVPKGGRSTDVVDPATSHEWSETSVCGGCGKPARKVQHETVKPLAIMRWLIRLITPPGGLVLDPFAGSGTTIEAAILEGFPVTGIEREADYLPLIQARIDRATAPTPETEPSLFDGLTA